MPLTIVPALAALVSAVACSDNVPRDPCEQQTYVQSACTNAVAQRGYWYGGTWYPHVYPFLPLYYHNRYTGYVAGGGRVRSMSPTTYAPGSARTARPSVVRGGFGSIGSGHSFAGS